MKNLKKMNVNKIVFLIMLSHSIISFSQKKEDVYFVLEDVNSEYAINNIMYGEKIGFIILLNKEEYQYHQKKVEEAKKNGSYHFDPASGRDNLNIKVRKLTFEVLAAERLKASSCEIDRLNLVDYEWILNNSWKKIAKQDYVFKDIYFLKKIDDNEYVSYKVGITIVDH
ncbi:hypothetical protein [Gelidibacter japonicus]|jgi:hypothetical protein|uniref:hypothetical protein n=1 Tax=Gelidibacter japonicus TaxID=1962232 RepID=UPI0013D0313B|nr:hypothetical protein [Gelidibacter japonicus]